ncbi:uncharacterized protein LOC108671690 [Hyalella azteca]|uniref:Uncharacterized protein LOC108671690 n=1 Tax=Hyalella azteca TaxID=294128 RepID=A0A8B7NM46_HYAAZ|nr:uncharacterized protein LOC108671690 [Hyalella azteca]
MEAVATASNATKIFSHSARSLSLYASVLIKDGMNAQKGKTILEKIIKDEPSFLPAVLIMSDVYIAERRYEKAQELLLRQAAVNSCYRVHERLADVYSKQQQHDLSQHHQTIAQHYANQGKLLFQGDVELSDLDAVWSDGDFSFTGQ